MTNQSNRPAVSVLIPSYMGQALLAKHLNKVLAIMRSGDQLVIVDDASPDQDKSKTFLTKKFKLNAVEQKDWPATIFQGKWQGIEIVFAINLQNY